MHAEYRKREPVHPDAETGWNRCGDYLPAELLPPRQAAEVVDRADGRRDRGAEEDPAHLATDREEVAMYGVLELLSAATATANAAVAEVAERYRQRPNTEIATLLTSVRTGAIARINEADFALSELERAHRGPQPIGFT